MNYLVIDFESHDPLMDTCGAGWPWGGVHLVGCSVYGNFVDNTWIEFQTDLDTQSPTAVKDLISLINEADILVAHNAQYDFGILHMLGIDIYSKILVDTILFGKLFDNRLRSYSLNTLAELYLDESKTSDTLGQFVRYAGLKRNKDGGIVRDIKQCTKWAKQNMHIVYDLNPQLIIKYALSDTMLTKRLYEHYCEPKNYEWITDTWRYKLSCVLKYLIKSRSKGIELSRDDLVAGRDKLLKTEQEALQVLITYGGPTYNPNSGPQTEVIIKRLKIPYEIKAKTGNAILDGAYLEKQTHEFCKTLLQYRRCQKARRDFFDKLLKLGELIHESSTRAGMGMVGNTPARTLPSRFKLYPEFNIFGAETGRFSGKNPNLQNIPARDEEIGELIRKCFLPRQGEKWYQMDYGQQEFRLFGHYAHISGIDSVIKLEYDVDPRKDYHQVVADLVSILRKYAKTVNLMSLYGAGRRKQSGKLVAAGLTQLEAESVYDKYHELFPSVKKFSSLAANTLKSRGYVKTILGRRLRLEKPSFDVEAGEWRTFDYQAISKIIQGSAADQMIECIVQCYEKELSDFILFTIHDQLCISAPNDEIPRQIRAVMLESIKLSVPMIADIGVGSNWAEAESIKH